MFNFHRILIPTDFSSVSQAAIEAGANLADKKSAELFLLHAQAPAAVLPPLEMSALPVVPTDDGTAIRKRLEQLPVPAGLHRLPVHREVVNGDPERVIAEFVEKHDIDVIVMGTHSRSALSHFILGSVTESVVRHSKCPVLTIPATIVQSSDSAAVSNAN